MRVPDPAQTTPPPNQENFRLVVEALDRMQPFLVKRFKQEDFLDSEDLAQEVIIRVLLRAQKIFIDNPDGFIYRVMINVCAEAHEARQRLREQRSQLTVDHCIERFVEDPFLQSQQAEDHNAQITLLKNSLEEELSPLHSRIIHMRFWEKMKYKEMADYLGHSQVNLRKEKSRAIEKLRKRFFPNN